MKLNITPKLSLLFTNYGIKQYVESLIMFKGVVMFCVILVFVPNSLVYSQDNQNRKNNEPSDSLKFEVVAELYQSTLTNRPDLAIQYAERALQLVEKTGDSIAIAYWNQCYGKAYESMESYYSAVKFYTFAHDIYLRQQHSKEAALLLVAIGDVYQIAEISHLASEYYQRANEIFVQHNDTVGIALVIEKEGESYLDNYPDIALAKFLDAKKLLTRVSDSVQSANILMYIGSALQKKGDYEAAIANLNDALTVFQNSGKRDKVAQCLALLGDTYCEWGNIERAEISYDMALINYQSLDLKYQIAQLMIKSAIVKLKQWKFYSAEHYAQDVLLISDNLGFNSIKAQVYLLYADLYQAKHDYVTALEYYKKYATINDSLIKEQNQLQYKLLDENIQTQKREKDLEKLNRVTQIKTYQEYILMGIGVIVVVIGWFAFSKYRNKVKANRLLAQKNSLIKEHQQELIKTLDQLADNEVILRRTNATKDKMFSIIGHDLRNPIGAFKTMLEIVTNDPENFEKEKLIEILKMLYASASSTYNLLENLLYWAKSQQGTMNFVPEYLDIIEIIDENLMLFLSSAKSKGIKLKSEISPEVINHCALQQCYVIGDKNMITTVLRNLISNSIKFTRENGEITIKAHIQSNGEIAAHIPPSNKQTKYVLIEVADNGVGIKPDILPKLFKPDNNFSYVTYGTNNEKGSGLGLVLCKEFIEKNNGFIWVESQENAGSQFKFILPVFEV